MNVSYSWYLMGLLVTGDSQQKIVGLYPGLLSVKWLHIYVLHFIHWQTDVKNVS